MNTYKLVRCVLAAGRGGAWKKFALTLMLACLFAPASSRAQNAYVGNETTVSAIDTATDAVIATIPVSLLPFGVAVTPDGGKVYITLQVLNSVQVINTATNTVIATIPVGLVPQGVVVTPDGSEVYVADSSTASGALRSPSASAINSIT
jgi:YVTN family beta-propeller protein